MERQRSIVVMLAVGAVLALGLLYFMREDIRLAVRDTWEMRTGKTVTVLDTDTGEQSVMPETSYAEETADDGDTSDEESEEMMEDEEEVSQDEEAAAEAAEAVYSSAWSAEARGYLSVESQECPPWESCGEVKIAYFVVTDTKSPELAAYLGVSDGAPLRFPLGCDEGSAIRFIPYAEMASSQRFDISGETFSALRASSQSSLVTLRFSKAVWPEDGGTEGPVCVSPFSEFEALKR
jgi:hypothetical protein